ncbi:putative DNA-binding domain-containing protein [Dyella sp. EPa41]|uniref:HvfC/BufC family peptide modification chaperone n=1 Tax=Dyella sp. EPa41 TaxID=1561194 RepID=UPI0019161DBD|nr:putative DNA-binding domain-containing protein [Dyella sp. EPa41]
MSGLRAMQLQLADALRSEAMPSLALLRGDGVADATSRLAVYHHGYRARLVEALHTEFPGLALLAGKQFARVLHDYVTARPSSHFNIRWHGEGLATFLGQTAPWSNRPALAQMAQLDWAISTAFDAADHATIGAGELAQVPADAWATLRLHPLPHARLLRATHNVDAFRRAADRHMARPSLRRLRQPRHLLVWRPALEVRYRPVAPAELPALQAALDGETFATLCARLAERHGTRAALPRMAALLGQWLDDGLIGRLDMG